MVVLRAVSQCYAADGGPLRFTIICFIATLIYLYNVGFFRPMIAAVDREREALFEADGAAAAAAEGAAAAPERAHTGPIHAIEKFILGLFASLHPGWTPPAQT